MTENAPIVVGVDGSPASDAAVRWAAATAARRTAPLHLVAAAYTEGTNGVPIGLPPAYLDEQADEHTRHLTHAADLAHRTTPSPRTVDTELVPGYPGRILLERSETAQMIVLGSRGRGEITGGLVGSVSSSVAAHAECPVAVVRAPDADTADRDTASRAVVVGVDGTVNSVPAIAEAYREASLRGVHLVAVHAWSDVRLTSLHKKIRSFDWPTIRDRERAALSENLSGFHDDHPDVTVEHVVVEDRPVQALVAHSTDAQLLVVGSRGRGGIAGLLLGSTSRTLLHQTTCPLLIVHTPHRE